MGCDFAGGDIDQIKTAGDYCATKCRENPECTRFTWTRFENGTCFLKSGEGNEKTAISVMGKHGRIDGTRVCGFMQASNFGDRSELHFRSF